MNIGQRLREKRLKKGLTIEDIAKATKIRIGFLQAIENSDYKKLPSVRQKEPWIEKGLRKHGNCWRVLTPSTGVSSLK